MKQKKSFKVVFADLAKEQVKRLPKEVKVGLDKALRKISKNPMEAQGSMSLFGKPSVKELRRWMEKVTPEKIDLVFEYLNQKGCLTKRGKELAHNFWKEYIHKNQKKLTKLSKRNSHN